MASACDRRAEVTVAVQVHRTQPHLRSVPGGQIREEILNRGFVTELVLEQTTTVVGDDELDVNVLRQQRRKRTHRVNGAARSSDREGYGIARINRHK
jgi:hypothetical protein